MMTMDGKEQQTMGATHSLLYRELLVTQNKLAEQVEWVKHVFGEDRKAVAAALARVAELEPQLAAQGWQPVTITEPSPDFTVELIVVGYRGHDGYWHYPDGPEGLVIRGWRPVPVAAMEENQQ